MLLNRVSKNHATIDAELSTLQQAKKECREWSKLTMAVANLASEIKQAIVETMDLPAQRDPLDGNPFTEYAHEKVSHLDEVSSTYKAFSDDLSNWKRSASAGVMANRSRKAFHAGTAAVYVALAVPTFGFSLVMATAVMLTSAKIRKESLITRTENFTQELSTTFTTFEMDPLKSLDSEVTEMKNLRDSYGLADNNEKIKSLFNEIDALKTQLDNPENNPFIHKLKAAKEAHEELAQSVKGRSKEDAVSTLHFALNDLKKTENYKPIRTKVLGSSNTDKCASDIDHVFAKLEKRGIKRDIAYQKWAEIEVIKLDANTVSLPNAKGIFT